MENSTWTTGYIAKLLNGTCEGDDSIAITSIATLSEAKEGQVSFLSNHKYAAQAHISKASAIIVGRNFLPKASLSTTLIRVDAPYLAFTALQEVQARTKSLVKKGMENPHFIGDGATVGADCYIGAFAYIGHGCSIGDRVRIYPHTYVGDNCVIESDTIIYAGARLHEGTQVGRYCTIQSGAVIGSEGFGFAPRKDGSFQKVPQLGHVTIQDHVDIGANTTIDCGTVGTTLIESGVKIDNLVQVAHNVKIGKDTVIAAQTGISGSTSIGQNVLIGGQVGTVGHIHIADRTRVGARAGVTKDTKSNQTLFGVPAIDRQQYLKSYAIYKKLPEVMAHIELLEQKLLNLASGKDK